MTHKIINRKHIRDVNITFRTPVDDKNGIYVVIDYGTTFTMHFPKGLLEHVKLIRTVIQTSLNGQMFIDTGNMVDTINLKIDGKLKADKDYSEAHD